MNSRDEDALRALRASLLRRPRPQLRPDQGDEAFDQHMLLAAAVHRAACLYRSGDDGKVWNNYVTAFFPVGRNSPDDAYLLWTEWRCSLLKEEEPIVPITHGHPELHWQREKGRPILNLEDAWDDYAYSVDRFIDHLRADPHDRSNALRRWRERSWTVRPLQLDSAPASGGVAAAHAASAGRARPLPPRPVPPNR